MGGSRAQPAKGGKLCKELRAFAADSCGPPAIAGDAGPLPASDSNYRSPNEDRAAPTLRNPIRKPHRKEFIPHRRRTPPPPAIRPGLRCRWLRPADASRAGQVESGTQSSEGDCGRPGPMRNATDRQLRTRTGSYEHGPAATNTDRPASLRGGPVVRESGGESTSFPDPSSRSGPSSRGLWPRKAT